MFDSCECGGSQFFLVESFECFSLLMSFAFSKISTLLVLDRDGILVVFLHHGTVVRAFREQNDCRRGSRREHHYLQLVLRAWVHLRFPVHPPRFFSCISERAVVTAALYFMRIHEEKTDIEGKSCAD